MPLPLWTVAKAIGGLGQVASAAKYAHRQFYGGNQSRFKSYRRNYRRMRPYPTRRNRGSKYRSYRRKYRMPMRLSRKLRRTKYGSFAGVQKKKMVILNQTLDYKFLDHLSSDKIENAIHWIDVLKKQWLPDRQDIPDAKVNCWASYEQIRLKCVYIEMRNFNERRLIKYSDDRVEERTPGRMLMRYTWDNSELLGNATDGKMDGNFNKLGKKKIIYKQRMKPSYRYRYYPKYNKNEGWCEFQDQYGGHNYSHLFNTYKENFADFMNKISADNVTRFVPNVAGSFNITHPKFLPRFYFCHELEYSDDQFDKEWPTHIKSVDVHMNFEINIKSVWEFRSPKMNKLKT